MGGWDIHRSVNSYFSTKKLYISAIIPDEKEQRWLAELDLPSSCHVPSLIEAHSPTTEPLNLDHHSAASSGDSDGEGS